MLPLPKILNTSKAPDPHAEYTRFEQYLQSQIQSGAAGDVSGTQYDNITLGYLNNSKKWVCRTGNVNGTMWGSPWANRRAIYTSSLHYCLRHCFPDAESFNLSVSRNDKLIVMLSSWTRLSSFQGYARNGYTSLSTSTAADGGTFISFVFYNPVLRKVQTVNPSLSAPTFTDFIF